MNIQVNHLISRHRKRGLRRAAHSLGRRLGWLVLLALGAAANTANAAAPSVVEHPTGRIVLTEVGPVTGLARDLAPVAAAAARELPARLGVGLPPRVEVMICGDQATFARFAGRGRTATLLGVALPGRQVAALNASLLVPGPERGPAGVLRHELAHLAMGVAAEAGGPIPRWYDEGTASWFAGGLTEIGALDFVVSEAAPDLALARLADHFPEDPAAMRIAYVKSQLAIELLERRPGPGTVAALGGALARGVPFATALRATTGLDTDGLDRALRKEQAPHGFLLSVLRRSVSPFFLMALLVVLGYVLRRRRLRARLAAWERAESGAPPGADADAGGRPPDPEP